MLINLLFAAKKDRNFKLCFQPQFEQRYLELLKLRFSEGELQQCEVMLKDMRDSEHIDRLVDNLLVNLINMNPIPLTYLNIYC